MRASGVKMMNIAHQLVMMADSTSETWYELVDDASGGRGVIYRSRIHVVLAEISHVRHLGLWRPAWGTWS